ncbi:hypothetical protein ABW19_dt0208853 [Dactylella cylindrospora]|nr:hypothetical protein ABW19_dt0208853 [Dactylella cylindrospora]
MAPIFPKSIVFSTGNIISVGLRRTNLEKSNQELVNSLRQNFRDASNVYEQTEPDTEATARWVGITDDIVHIPSQVEPAGLNEERIEYDITVKLFVLPAAALSDRISHIRQALDYVLRELRVANVDLLIVSFPNVSFDADDDSFDAEPPESEIAEWAQTYTALEGLVFEGRIKRIGLAEFGVARLAKLLPYTTVKPSVDQINVRDCCVVPKPLIMFAKEHNIELLTHNDCTNILPPSTLSDLLEETNIPSSTFGKIVPQWVVKYTAVIQDRGVVENKGYFAMARGE